MHTFPSSEEPGARGDGDLQKLAQQVLALATGVLTCPTAHSTREQALSALASYADWRKMELPGGIRRALRVQETGEQAVREMERAGLICASCGRDIVPEQRRLYPFPGEPNRFLCEPCSNAPLSGLCIEDA
jgi:hypothetical protein